MNNFGYDFYTPNDTYYFDELSYSEQIKPLDKIEHFTNEVNDKINNPTDEEMSTLQKLYTQKEYFCNVLQQKYKECVSNIQQKNNELLNLNSHMFLMYFLLVFSIIFIFYQRININNLNQMICFMQWNLKNSKPIV
jgi:hypothetical protein